MRLRALAAAAALCLTPTTQATARPSTITIEGQLGTVRITEARLRALMADAEGVPQIQAGVFLSRLSPDEQIALNYAVNTTLITRMTPMPKAKDAGPCGATVEDCDPPAPRRPQYEVEKPVPEEPTRGTPPPPVCRDDYATLEARTALFDTVAYVFEHHVYWCYDKRNVTDVQQSARYDVRWPLFWSCVESADYPRKELLPAPAAPSVTATAIGLCIYTAQVEVEALGRTFRVAFPPRNDYPTISQQMRYDGGCSRLKQ